MRWKTITKLRLARATCSAVVGTRRLFGCGPVVVAGRHGLTWKLDLRQGIDLAIYLFGRFERETYRAYRKIVAPGDTVLDIGSNIGAHTLPMADCVGDQGRVIAFEPTEFAFEKLEINVRLNPDLARRITLLQVLLVSDVEAGVKAPQYSSWPLTAIKSVDALHGGELKSTASSSMSTLDELLEAHAVRHVDLIKMDVDGNEYDVLKGGLRTLRTCRPKMIMEIAPYCWERLGPALEDLVGLMSSLDYRFFEVAGGRPLPSDAEFFRRTIPHGAGINVLAAAGDLRG